MRCRPWWVNKFLPYAGGPRISKPGCGTILNTEDPNYGWNPCSPESLRAHAESVVGGPLSLDTYSLARNIASEQGSGTIEMKMALALSTMGQARLRGQSVTQVILTNTLGRQLYGRIMAANGVTGATYHRWTASSADPQVVDVLIAAFALSGGAGRAGDPANFALGADDQATANASCVTKTSCLPGATGEDEGRNYWVGPIPNVNPQALFLFRHMPDVAPASPTGKQLIARGLSAQRAVGDVSWQVSGTCPPPVFLHPVTGMLVAFTATLAVGGGIMLLRNLRQGRRLWPLFPREA